MGFGKTQKPTKEPKLDYSYEVEAMASCIFDSEAISLPKMSLSVPYHPYKSCLICGSSQSADVPQKRPTERDTEGREWEVEWWPIEGPLVQKCPRKLQRCSGCKQALYCSHNCQRHDWNVHRRECALLQDENNLALAMSETDAKFASATDGRSLRTILISEPDTTPLLFVLAELKASLTSSMPHWDPENVANGMAINRMTTLTETVRKVAFLKDGRGRTRRLPWLELSSVLFGTCMVHKVINDQAKEGFKFGQNAWFESFLYNFGEVCDRIKLYALLEDNGYAHFLSDDEFPLLKMKEPSQVNGQCYFNETRLKIGPGKKCMICGKGLQEGPAISAHDPNRSGDRSMPRQINFLPPRPPHPAMAFDKGQMLTQKAELKMKTWLHVVARTKTIPKDFVCSEDCEQHSIYGRLFDGHPLNHTKTESASNSSSNGSDTE